MTSPLPSLTYLLALSDESSWADLLATLILTDPDTLAGLLGGVDSNAFLVRRDFPLGRGRTVDLVVTAAGRPIVALETSVMEDINPHLLAAIDADFPEECVRGIIHLGSLPTPLPDDSVWQAWSWEDVLGRHATSDNTWVSLTARAWIEHIDTALPMADGDTTWSGIALEDSPVAALRVRSAWLVSQLSAEAHAKGIRIASTSGRSGKRWGLEMRRPTSLPDYDIVVYLHERTRSDEIPSTGGTLFIPRGPEALVSLRHRGAATSDDFDWNHLLVLASTFASARDDWFHTRKPNLVGVDRDRYSDFVAAGGPPHLGFGVGDEPTFHTDDIAFGAKITFRPDVTLSTLSRELSALMDTVVALSEVPPSTTPSVGTVMSPNPLPPIID